MKIKDQMRPLRGKKQRNADKFGDQQKQQILFREGVIRRDLHQHDQDDGINRIESGGHHRSEQVQPFEGLRPFFGAEKHRFQRDQKNGDFRHFFNAFGKVHADIQ